MPASSTCVPSPPATAPAPQVKSFSTALCSAAAIERLLSYEEDGTAADFGGTADAELGRRVRRAYRRARSYAEPSF